MAGEMNYSLSDLRAAVGDGDGMFGGNNSAIWLILLFFLFGGRGGWGNNLSEVAAKAATEDSVKTVQSTLDTNTLLNAVQGNREAITSLAQSMNCGFDRMSECCCATQRLIEQVGNATNLSIKDLSANTILQSKELSQLIQGCCCEVKTLMLQGFNSVDKSVCDVRNSLNLGFSSVNTSVERGFSNLGFLAEKNTNAIIQAGHIDTDRILDWLNTNRNNELSEKLSLARAEISQRDQSAYIINQIKNGCSGCNGCC